MTDAGSGLIDARVGGAWARGQPLTKRAQAESGGRRSEGNVHTDPRFSMDDAWSEETMKPVSGRG